MFTGLIEQQGEVIDNSQIVGTKRIVIRANFNDLQAGESIAVDGVCLTLLPDFDQLMQFDVSSETLNCTTLGEVCVGSQVNLERAMLSSARFGGHYVSGHVDATSSIKSCMKMGDFLELTLGDFQDTDLSYLIPKGSVAINGVSLTINAIENGEVKLLLVPHTLMNTTLGQRKIGERVNVEFDYLARIVAHQFKIIGDLPKRV